MKNTFGNSVAVTIFGESHGEAIGAVIDGMAPGIAVDFDFVSEQLSLRRPVGKISTPRSEKDNFSIVSGVFNGKTTGTPICVLIPNEDTRSKDYNYGTARPGHADFTAYAKYNGFEDYRGGGHFSGRITAAITAAGAIAISALRSKGIVIGTHIKSIHGVSDRDFNNLSEDINNLNKKEFAVLDDSVKDNMIKTIENARNENNSVGGILETAVVGLPVGVGEPWFDTVEGVLSHAVFSIPAVKGIEFGAGFKFAEMTGSEANDEFEIDDNKVVTRTNSNAGINGGITNGMPVVFKTVIKPTPTISKPQSTVDFLKKENTEICAGGRHDPCIVHRARVVIDSVTALALCDLLAVKFGTDWLAK